LDKDAEIELLNTIKKFQEEKIADYMYDHNGKLFYFYFHKL
jgi:hypothetical protein